MQHTTLPTQAKSCWPISDKAYVPQFRKNRPQALELYIHVLPIVARLPCNDHIKMPVSYNIPSPITLTDDDRIQNACVCPLLCPTGPAHYHHHPLVPQALQPSLSLCSPPVRHLPRSQHRPWRTPHHHGLQGARPCGTQRRQCVRGGAGV